MLALGPYDKDKKYSMDKANTDIPKVNKGCRLLTANGTSADCVENTPGHLIQHIPLRIYHTEIFNVMIYNPTWRHHRILSISMALLW